ncbi:stage II sporulation protein E [Thermoactinomyces sp. DSM 45892]|uniref:stage II sporulation protein E n=1 Tax=Thermoactinomyces sp. DSM 45892 TaxID=1882753 RepID=UPI0008943C95|nr:stage II sporulation protein E [Thermoactinomyces sp. DSM 45892]SDY94740.1 stage II sporulation protein E [Thermoactinomyces sp. DSM 45892]
MMEMMTRIKHIWKSPMKKIRSGSHRVHKRLISWNVPIMVMGFLLGRALILESVSPFALAYLAVMLFLSRKQWPVVMASLIVGATTISMIHAGKITAYLVLLLGVYKLFQTFGKATLYSAPMIVLTSSMLGNMVAIWYFDTFTNYQYLLAGVDILISFILTFIFVQALPVFTVKRNKAGLKHEEMVCLVILLGSVMTGTLGWAIADLEIVNIVSRYLILVLAIVGGSMLGSSMGVVTGLILHLSNPKSVLQISLLAFAGLLAGLFKEGKRLGVAIGFLLGTTILSLYGAPPPNLWISMQETLLALLLFFLTPDRLFHTVAKFVPGTWENQMEQQDYVRRLRDVTAAKVEHFTNLFYELASSFREDMTKQQREDEDQVHQFVTTTMEHSCMGCAQFQQCWEGNIMKTYQGMTSLMTVVEQVGARNHVPIPQAWDEYCIRPDQVVRSFQDQYAHYEHTLYWRDKIKDTRRLVGDQLTGMAEVMDKLATEIRIETQVMHAQEEQIHAALDELGIQFQRVEILNLAEGKVEIEVFLPHQDLFDECKKLIAPLMTEVLGEPISVYRKVVQDGTQGAIITLGSAQRFELKSGVANAAKGGAMVSGDSYCYMNLGTGRFAVALSDGMGNGQRAQEESNAALKLLRRLLQAGMNEERAVETINSILSLRTSDEVFATIDLAMIDLNSAKGRFMKIGSTPGFIKRGKKVLKLSASNPPIGILKEIDVEPIETQLQAGDLIVMMTDGIYDAAHNTVNKDAFITKIINEIDTKDPQDFADCLLEKIVRYRQGEIPDDMTVLVSKVEKHTSEWSTIRLSNVRPIERPQEVPNS